MDVIKQYPGPQQVQRAVKVNVPGRHFPQLQPAEQAVLYEATAVDFAERHKFEKHLKAWGAAHTGPGIRFVCVSDAVDDPDHKGFWTTLSLWNRWRHETYKDRRQQELPFLDKLPELPTTETAPAAAATKAKEDPEVKQHFVLVSTGTHVSGGTGRMSGKQQPAFYFACKVPGCKSGQACDEEAPCVLIIWRCICTWPRFGVRFQTSDVCSAASDLTSMCGMLSQTT